MKSPCGTSPVMVFHFAKLAVVLHVVKTNASPIIAIGHIWEESRCFRLMEVSVRSKSTNPTTSQRTRLRPSISASNLQASTQPLSESRMLV